jgi:hypothetical protein
VLTGYAGWAAGQLDEEIAASAWLTADVDLDLVFDTPADEMWEATIRRLGADPGPAPDGARRPLTLSADARNPARLCCSDSLTPAKTILAANGVACREFRGP